jgi:2-dehydro-3-deoxygluconokinase
MPDRSAADVVTLGESMQLLVADPGTALRRARQFRACISGAETNVAIGLARMGLRARWLGRVGSDAAGQAVLAILRSEDVDVSAVEHDPGRHTGVLMRDSHPSRTIDVQYLRAGSAASALDAEYVRRAGLDGARLVHVTGITAMLSDTARDAVHALMDLARTSGATVSFDPNVRRKLGSPQRWREVTGPLLAKADLVFAGADELEVITGERSGKSLLGHGAAAVVVKHADLTATVTTADGEWRQAPLATTVVDPVGAGDALVSGYLASWLDGAPPVDALRAAVVSAALVVGALTDTEGLPDRAEHLRAARAFASSQDVVDR